MLVAELGDITRFANPRQFMAYLGLVPSEHSSGSTRRQGGITKAGRNRQKLRLALGEPLPRRRALTLRAVTVAAGIVGDAFVRTVLAALDVSAERRGPTGLDRRHHLQLGKTQMASVGLAPRRAMGAKDVGDLQARPRHAASVRRARIGSLEVEAQPLERALDVADRVDGDAGVERGRLQFGVAEQDLDHADVDVLFEQVSGEAVPQGVRRDALGDARRLRRGVNARARAGGPTSG